MSWLHRFVFDLPNFSYRAEPGFFVRLCQLLALIFSAGLYYTLSALSFMFNFMEPQSRPDLSTRPNRAPIRPQQPSANPRSVDMSDICDPAPTSRAHRPASFTLLQNVAFYAFDLATFFQVLTTSLHFGRTSLYSSRSRKWKNNLHDSLLEQTGPPMTTQQAPAYGSATARQPSIPPTAPMVPPLTLTALTSISQRRISLWRLL